MQDMVEMTEAEKVVFLKALIRLARADGNFDEDEKAFIREISLAYGVAAECFDEVLAVASDDELVDEVKKIKNRHMAMYLIKEMCTLANSDGDLSDAEMLLIGRVGEAMGLELEKIQQISQWVIDRIIWIEQGKIIFEKF